MDDIWYYDIDIEKGYSAMLGYTLFDKTKWGKGIAAASVGLFLKKRGSNQSILKEYDNLFRVLKNS